MSCLVLSLLLALSPVLSFLLLPGVSASQEVLWEDYKHGRLSSELHDEHNCSWKCLVFALQWPGGFCQVGVTILTFIFTFIIMLLLK